MDFEKNDLHINNEDGVYKADEENQIKYVNEIFREEKERFIIKEENQKPLEENNFNSSIGKKIVEDNNVVNSTNKAVHSLKAVLAIPTVTVSLVVSVGIVGTQTGIIPTIETPHVSCILSRSTELGFKVNIKDKEKLCLLSLNDGDRSYSQQIDSSNQAFFYDLNPNTIYDLTLYDMSVEPFKKLYNANYLTKEKDNYYAYISEARREENLLDFYVGYEGENISFVTVTLFGDNDKTIYTYEGNMKEFFNVDILDNSSVTCKISINGETVLYTQLLYHDDPHPYHEWSYDEYHHWIDKGGEKYDVSEHDFEETILVEPTYDQPGLGQYVCYICGYHGEEYQIPALEHNYSDLYSFDEHYHWRQCIDEGYTDLTIDHMQHNMELSEHHDPTETEDGYDEYYCPTCGYIISTTIPHEKHNYDTEYSFDESTHWHQCIDEGYEELRGDENIHNLVIYEEHEPTYEIDGYIAYRCDTCGYSYTESLPRLEHNYETKWTYDEEYHWHQCIDEGYEELKGDLANHNMREYSHRDATYEDAGFTIYSCDDCPYYYREEIPQLEHTYATEWTYDDSQHWHECLDEGYEGKNNGSDIDFHSFNSSGECVCGLSAFEFELQPDSGNYTITGIGDHSFNYSNLVLPTKYNDVDVTMINTKLFENGGVNSLVIPDSYTYLESGTVYGCSTLESISLPYVGSNAFNEEVSDESFFGYIFGTEGYGGYDPTYWVDMTDYGGAKNLIPQSLKVITINGGNLLDNSLRGLYYVEKIYINNVTSIGAFAFADYIYYDQMWEKEITNLESITIDNSVTYIGSYAFFNNPLETLSYGGTMEEWELVEKAQDWSFKSSLNYVRCSDGTININA